MGTPQSKSRYKLITDEFRQYILNGDWPINQLIKTEQELCQIYSVSRLTIRNALTHLVHEGLLERRSGKGTWVRDFRKIPWMWSLEEVSHYFIYPEHITTEIVGVDDLVAGSSDVGGGCFSAEEILTRIRVVRMFKKTPFALNYVHLREADAKAVLDAFDPQKDIFFYQVLERQTGKIFAKLHEAFKADLARGETVTKLKIEPGHPVLNIYRDLFDSEGRHLQTNIMYLNTEIQAMQTIRTKGSNNGTKSYMKGASV